MKILLLFIFILSACSSKQNQSTPAEPAKAATLGPVSLKIISPANGEVVQTADVPVKFDLQNYDVQPNGQHIHLMIDNEAYQPCYTVAEPCVIKDVKPGAHTLRAFPARAWHEAIKDPGAFATAEFFVQNKTGKVGQDLNSPLLTYSRPKGKYEGDKADKILFDFWLTNAELGPDKYKVRFTLDKQKPMTVDEWKPRFFEKLSDGKHKLKIELLNAKGKLVAGKFNKTEREFEVKH